MPTLKSSEHLKSETFTCPTNKGVNIHDSCPISACPYHASRLENLFEITTLTKCSLFEPALMGQPSLATLQKSLEKKISATTLRTNFNQALLLTKSKLSLINEVPDSEYCEYCGKYDCENPHGLQCKADRLWSKNVLIYYGLVPNIFRRAIVWKLHGKNDLFIPKKLAERK